MDLYLHSVYMRAYRHRLTDGGVFTKLHILSRVFDLDVCKKEVLLRLSTHIVSIRQYSYITIIYDAVLR